MPPTAATPGSQGVTKISDEPWAQDLLHVVEHFEQAEQFVRENQMRKWRKHLWYWDSIQYLWWSEVAHDWRTPDQAVGDMSGDDQINIDPSLYAKVVNIYRAHGEVIIAAMSATVPKVTFPPDDADNTDDVLTAKAYTKLAEVVHRHNFADLLLVKALFILYNQGLVCGYNDNFKSADFGTNEVPVKEDITSRTREYMCPECGDFLGSEQFDLPASDNSAGDPENIADEGGIVADAGEGEEEDIQSPGPNVLPANNTPPPQAPPIPPPPQPMQQSPCPNCGTNVKPEFEDFDERNVRITGYESESKTRELISVWGPLNVKIPQWCKRLADSPYLILETEEHFARLQSIYEEIWEDIQPKGEGESYESSLRTSRNYEGMEAKDLCNTKRCWLRPWAFNVLGKTDEESDPEDKVGRLKSMFPKGCYCVIINGDILAEAIEDQLDEHWTVTESPLSDTLHAEALGAPLIPIQEMTNELVNLDLESIEHQIPETYADSDVIDWDAYRDSEARPGMLYPANKKPGEALGNSFYEIKGNSLSREVESFAQRLERFAQFVIGSLPSVFGGQIEGGSGTAREYEMSRAQALQRLSTVWHLVTIWWTQVTSKAVKSFANNMVGDEKIVSDKGGGSFINTWIRQAQMRGKTGNAYAESSESLPINWNQKRDVVLNLMQLKDPMIGEILAHPENSSFIARLVGLPELYLPGDDDRNKQLREIAELIQGEPVQEMAPMGPNMAPGAPMMDPTMPPPMVEKSSVPIDPRLDNNAIESAVCAAWLKSEVGQEMKRDNPGAYLNVLLHKVEHDEAEAQKMMQQAQGGAPGQPQGQGQPADNNVEPVNA